MHAAPQDAGPPDARSSTPAAPARRSRWRWPLRIAGGVVVLAGLGLAFAPTIAGSLAPGIIAEQAGKALNGSARVKSVSLSWGGPQTLDELVVLDAQGTEVARATVRASKGLLGLATGGLDLGDVTISSARVALTRDAQGKLNVASLVKQDAPTNQPANQPATPPAKSPITLPKGLRLNLKVDSLDATLVDQSQPTPTTLTLSNLKLDASIDAAKPLDVTLKADASVARGTSGAAPTDKGTIDLALQATSWAKQAASGDELTLASAQAKGTLALTNLPVALLDALAGPVVQDSAGNPVPLTALLGNTLGVQVSVDGSMANAKASLDARTTNLQAAANLAIADGVLSQQGAITARLAGSALQRIAPQLMEGAATAQAATPPPTTFTTLPDASVTIEGLRLSVPKDGAPLDLRGAAATVNLALTEARGSVRLPGQPAQPLVIAPLLATIATQDLAQGATARANTSATLSGASAGTLTLDAALRDLLTPQGGLRLPAAGSQAIPSGVNASLVVKDMATIIAQPFVQALGIDLGQDIGSTLNFSARVASADAQGVPIQSSGQANAQANTQASTLALTLDASAQHVSAKGTMLYAPTRLASTNEGFTITLGNAGNVLGALTEANPSLRIAHGPGANASTALLSLPYFDIALANNAPQLHQSQVQASFEASNLALTNPANTSPAIVVQRTEGSLLLFAGGRIELGGTGSLSHAGSPFGLGYDIKAPGVLAAPKAGEAFALADVWSLRPTGSLELGGLPTSLLAWATPAAAPTATASSPPPDLVALVREVAGPQLTLRSTFSPAGEGGKDGVSLIASLTSDRVKGDVSAVASDTQVLLRLAKVDCIIAPPTLAEVLRQFAPDLAPRPQLQSQATATLMIDPMVVPLDASKKPQLDKAGLLKGRLLVPDAMIVSNVLAPAPGASGSQLERIGLRGTSLEFEAPVASLLPAKAEQPAPPAGAAKATLRSGFLGAIAGQTSPGAVRDMGTMSGNATIALAGGKPGVINATLGMESLPAVAIDAFANTKGLVLAALGGDFALSTTATITPGATPQGPDFASATIDAQASLASPNVKMQPLALRVLPTEIVLAQPGSIDLWTTPELASQFVKPTADGKPAAFTLSRATTTRITLTELRLPRAPKDGSPASSPLVAQASITVPGAELRTRDGKALLLGELSTRVSTLSQPQGAAKPGDLAYALSLASAQIEGSPRSETIGFEGHVRNLRDDAGAFSMQRAVVDVRGQVPSMPTSIADTLAQQDGLLVDALGESMRLALNVAGFPLGDDKSAGKGGTIDATFTSPRATAQLQGDIGEGVLIFRQPVQARLLEVTTGLSARLVKGLPLVGSFTKAASQEPASLRGEGLVVPLDKDFSKLNGVVTIDPGEAQFATSGFFNELLNLVKLREAGAVGQRLQPLTITVVNGVATYPRWGLPLGEFTVQTEGKVDLVKRELDVVTWIPAGALADNTIGLFGGKNLLGGTVLEAASLLPFRTKGSLDAPSTSPDLALFAETTVKNLNPVDVIKGIGDLFKKPKPPPP